MGDSKTTLEKARKELEDMYLGIPDESVNLTFQDFAEVKKTTPAINKNGSSSNMPDAVKIAKLGSPSSSLRKLPDRDSAQHHRHSPPSPLVVANRDTHTGGSDPYRHDGGKSEVGHIRYVNGGNNNHHQHANVSNNHYAMGMGAMGYDDHDVSGVSMASTMYQERGGGGGGRRRSGIPHSNICTICSTYIYVFRHRCLVCGRVYCRNCVSIGMGEMTEGRKCIECLGRRFSQRYIARAGKMGCWTWSWRYSSMVKQAEVKWAEKGPRRNGERGRYGGSVMMSRSILAPAAGATGVTQGHHYQNHNQNQNHHQNHHAVASSISHSNPPSFVMTSATHSPRTPTHHLQPPF